MLEVRDRRFGKYETQVKKAAKACLLRLRAPSESRVHRGTTRGYHNAEVEIHLITDEEMRVINKKFCGKDKVTNVLSFEEPKGFPRPEKGGVNFLGEVYLAPEYIE